jgi:hypothetical protein
MMLERPHFQSPGSPPDPDDEYTHESVKKALSGLLEKVRQSLGQARAGSGFES